MSTLPSQLISRSIPANSLKQALKASSTPKRLLAGMVKTAEGTSGLSVVTFVQDTLSVWLPKALVSRSIAELAESSFLEFIESFLVYFSIPLLGKNVFEKAVKKLDPKLTQTMLNAGVDDIATIGKQLGKQAERKLLSQKSAIVIGTLGVASIAEYALTFAKNLMTAGVFGKTDFKDVANLNANEAQSNTLHPNESETVLKAKHRLKQTGLAALATVGFSGVLATVGHRVKGIDKLLKPFVRVFDFERNKLGQLGMKRSQLMAFMAIAAGSYLDASRGGLEKKEIITRLSIVFPFLLYANPALTKLYEKHLQKSAPALFEAGKVKSLEALSKLPQAEFQKLLPAKLKQFFVPLITGISVAGFGVGLLNRYWTKRRFENTQGSTPNNPPDPNTTAEENAFNTYMARMQEKQHHRACKVAHLA